MKVNRHSIAALGLGAVLIMSGVASAQNTNVTARPARRGPTVEQRVERMSSELKLTDDQKAKVTALFEKQAKQRRELFSESNVPREERREKMRALVQEENKQLKTILTSDQLEKWQTMREQMRARSPRPPGQDGGAAGEAAPAPAPAPQQK